MSTAIDKTTEDAFRALLRTCGLINKAMQPYFSRFGISGSQWGTLRLLHCAEKEDSAGLQLSEIGDRLLIRPPSVTGVVDRLQRMGFVSRKSAKNDLRAKRVCLTPAGRRLVVRILKCHSTQIQTVMNGLSLSEQTELCHLLKKMCSHLEPMAEQESLPMAK